MTLSYSPGQPAPSDHDASLPVAGMSGLTRMSGAQWRQAAQAHAQRADDLTSAWRQAHDEGQAHAVEDFLFQYYMIRPSRLRQWHPGIGVELDDGHSWAHKQWYVVQDGIARVDVTAFSRARSENMAHIGAILSSVAQAPARFSCFGLHEWAMVYRQPQHRHPLPLRLGQEGTDQVVDAHTIACSHYDAFRFFTPPARSLNTLQPSRDTICCFDQPGCLHANMDLYKYAAKMGPLVPGELLLDCFALAQDIRWLDMQASPYDMSCFGVPNVCIETPEGKEEYVRRQRQFHARAQKLRARLRQIVEAVGAHKATDSGD